MGDFGQETAIQACGNGGYRARLDPAWEIWGPMGGYVSAIALRAAGAEASLPRPVSVAVHYLSVATFDDVELQVTPLRRGRSAESLRVTMRQGDRPILEALVCTAAEADGLEHDVTEAPEVPGPDGLATTADLMEQAFGDDAEPPYPFWRNLESRPVAWTPDWPPPGPLDPVWREWERLLPTSTFADRWIDAARTVLLADLPSWPSASRHHSWKWADGPEWVAPSLDLYVAFHQAAPQDPWLLIDGAAPIAAEGLIGWNCRLWSSDRTLVASGGGQALCRRVPR